MAASRRGGQRHVAGRVAKRTGAPPDGESTRQSPPDVVTTVRVESIAAGGDGVARLDTTVCFIPRTAPGDTAQVALHMKKRCATGRLLQVVDPSPVRVEPRCHHYVEDRCGGCQLQHLGADAQRDARSGIVRDALLRLARRSVPIPDVVRGPSDWEYRRRLTLTLRRRGMRWIGGLHPFDDPVRVFALDECPISQPALIRAWHVVRAHDRALPLATTLRIAFRLLDNGLVAVVVTGGDAWSESAEWGATILRESPDVHEIWWEHGRSRLLVAMRTANVEGLAEANKEDHADSLAFVQINAPVASLLRDHVFDTVMVRTPQRVIDAYAGSGIMTARLVEQGIHVTAIEVDATATRRAKKRVAHAGNADIVTEAVERALPRALATAPEVVIVNPPRRGLEPGAPELLEQAARSGMQCIIYISCDPATLARDVSKMPSWRIESVRCFDMFPQTAHVETVCELVRSAA